MRPTSKHLPAQKRKDEAVMALVELAGMQDPSSITTADISKKMQVSQSALFRHFPTKKSIWHAVMGWVAEQLLSRLERSVRGIDSPLEALRTMLMSHVEFLIEHPGVPRMMFGEIQKKSMTPPKLMAQQILQRYSDRVAALLEKGKKTGDIAPDVNAPVAAALYLSMIQGMVIDAMLCDDFPRIRVRAPLLFEQYCKGVYRRVELGSQSE